MSFITASFCQPNPSLAFPSDAPDAFDRVPEKTADFFIHPGCFKSGSTDAQTVMAGRNRVQFIFLIALIRLSNTA
jgi:hypothetical protein